jgi:CBS domain-containing protein
MPDTVHELMSADPLTLAPDERLDHARALMISCRVRHLPVTTGGRLVGMVSARDLVGVPRLREKCAGEVMSSAVATATPELSIVEAVERLLLHGFSSLPVIDAGALVGILTTTDLVRDACTRLGDEQVGQLMSAPPVTTVETSTAVEAARLLMSAQHVRHLPVVESEALVGFLTDLDLLRAEPGPGLVVGTVLPASLGALSPDQRAGEAGRLLIRDRRDALPVTDGRSLAGILSVFDFLHYLESSSQCSRSRVETTPVTRPS